MAGAACDGCTAAESDIIISGSAFNLCFMTDGRIILSAGCLGTHTHGNSIFPFAPCQRPDSRAGIAFRQSIEAHGHRSVTGCLAHRAECHGCRPDGSGLDIIRLVAQSRRTKRHIIGRLIIQIFIIRQSRQKSFQLCTIQLDIIGADRHGRVSDRPCVRADSHRLRSVSLCHAADSHALSVRFFHRACGMIHIFDPYIRLCTGTDGHIAPGSVGIAVAADSHLSRTGQLMVFRLDCCRPVADSDVFIRLYAGFRPDGNRVIDGPLRRQLGNPFRTAGQADRICIPGSFQITGFGRSTESNGIIAACHGIIANGHNAFFIQLLISPCHKRICTPGIFQRQRAGFTADGQRTGAFRMGIVADGRSPHIIGRCRITYGNRRRPAADTVIPYGNGRTAAGFGRIAYSHTVIGVNSRYTGILIVCCSRFRIVADSHAVFRISFGSRASRDTVVAYRICLFANSKALYSLGYGFIPHSQSIFFLCVCPCTLSD